MRHLMRMALSSSSVRTKRLVGSWLSRSISSSAKRSQYSSFCLSSSATALAAWMSAGTVSDRICRAGESLSQPCSVNR